MKHLHKFLLIFYWEISSLGVSLAQTSGNTTDSIVTFRFLPGEEMFFLRGNEAKLNSLYLLIDKYRTEIIENTIPLYVDGYCASLPTEKENLMTAYKRANRVKSELIQHKGLKESNFITTNAPRAYYTNKDMVVVTLRIPAKTGKPATVRETPEREKPMITVQKQPEPIVEKEPETRPEPIVEQPAIIFPKPYCLAVRTNLLYDALLLPTLGIEWRINNKVGIKLDGSRSWWGNDHGKVQKVWLVSPEIRWYMGNRKNFYAGISGNYGEYNIYKYLLGSIRSKDTGHQGKMWGAGLTAGYQLPLSHNILLDFNLGLGYSCFDYDSYHIVEGTRVYKAKDNSKKFWGPTQAGISLVWTIGGNK